MGATVPPVAYGVALLGFGAFERHALASYLRLSTRRAHAFRQAETLADAAFAIADADDPAIVASIRAAGRAADTVFIGALAPEGALAWAMRPIDPLHVFRELDAAVHMRRPAPAYEAAADESAVSNGGRDFLPSGFDSGHSGLDSVPGAPGGLAHRAGDAAPPPLALLVDDSDNALRFLESQLHVLGLRTEAAAASARALELSVRQRFDIVFLDVDLGPASELDGLALCQRLKRRASGEKVPLVVFVSAAASPTDRVRGTLAGCDGYLAKPLDDHELEHLLFQLGLVARNPGKRRRSRRDDGIMPTSGSVPLTRPR